MTWTGPEGERTYSGMRVVELADNPAGEIVGKLLADEGATVIKVEPPDGGPSRGTGPWHDGREGDPDASLHFWTYNTSKRSVVLDPDDRGRRDALIDTADVVITTAGPEQLSQEGLDPETTVERRPELLWLSVSPFGLTGPWANHRTSDLVGLAAGGPLLSCGYDDHSIPPIRPGGHQAFQLAASFGHTSLLLALIEKQHSGLGQVVDVSMHEAVAVSGELANPYWFYPRVLVQRQTCRHAQPSPTQSALFQCADGVHVYFALILSDDRTWQSLVDWLDSRGMAADLTDEAYLDLAHRQANFPHVQTMVECFFLIMESSEAYEEGQRRGLPIGPVQAPEEILEDRHLEERGYFVSVELPSGGSARFPGAPYRFAHGIGQPGRPPRLGEHTEEELLAILSTG